MVYLITLILSTVVTIQVHTFNYPILNDKSYYDPDVIKVNGTYYLVTFTADISEGIFPVHISTDLIEWKPAGYLFDASNAPTWADKSSFISPDIHQVGSDFLLYFAAYTTTSFNWHIGVATAPHPLGPYTPTDQPLLSLHNQHSYDSTIINDEDNLFLVWSNYTHGINARQLDKDGLSFTSDQTTLLLKGTLSWEAESVYFPWYIRRGRYHYLVYTGGDCDGIGVARSTHALGPYEKLGDPIIVSNGNCSCTRDANVVKDGDNNNDVIIFNALINGSFDVVFASLGWNADDWPYVKEF